MDDIKRPITTLQLIGSTLSLLKTVAVVTVMMLLEWSRIKEQKAVDEAAVAATDLEILKAQTTLREATSEKEPSEIIDGFITRELRDSSKPRN